MVGKLREPALEQTANDRDIKRKVDDRRKKTKANTMRIIVGEGTIYYDGPKLDCTPEPLAYLTQEYLDSSEDMQEGMENIVRREKVLPKGEQ